MWPRQQLLHWGSNYCMDQKDGDSGDGGGHQDLVCITGIYTQDAGSGTEKQLHPGHRLSSVLWCGKHYHRGQLRGAQEECLPFPAIPVSKHRHFRESAYLQWHTDTQPLSYLSHRNTHPQFAPFHIKPLLHPFDSSLFVQKQGCCGTAGLCLLHTQYGTNSF